MPQKKKVYTINKQERKKRKKDSGLKYEKGEDSVELGSYFERVDCMGWLNKSFWSLKLGI